MTTYAKPCIVCGKKLPNVTDDSENQPSGGTCFQSHGQYGSTIFDPMDGSYIEIIVCDECLMRYRNRVMIGREAKPVLYEGSVVGFCKTPNRPLMDWNINAPTSFSDPNPANNIMHIDEDVLEHPENYPEITFNVEPETLLMMTRLANRERGNDAEK